MLELVCKRRKEERKGGGEWRAEEGREREKERGEGIRAGGRGKGRRRGKREGKERGEFTFIAGLKMRLSFLEVLMMKLGVYSVGSEIPLFFN